MDTTELLEKVAELLEKAGKCPPGKRRDAGQCVDVAQVKRKTPSQPDSHSEVRRPKIDVVNPKNAETKDPTGRWTIGQKAKAKATKTADEKHPAIVNSPSSPAPDRENTWDSDRADVPTPPTTQGGTKGGRKSKKPHPEWTVPRLSDELGDLRRVSKKEGIRFYDLMHHASAAVSRPDNLEPLDYGHWKNIQDTESYGTNTHEKARAHAKKHGRNFDRVIHGFRTGAKMPAPIVLVKHDGTSTLVSGNTRLMAARAHGIRPKVLTIRMPREVKPEIKDNKESTSIVTLKSKIQSLHEMLESNE